MRPDIAGCTLLALGNSAPDVAAQVAALDPSQHRGAQIAISEVVGSGFFAGTAGLAAVTFATQEKPATVMRYAFCRDVGFYLAAICLCIAMLVHGNFSYLHAASFASLYAVYIAVLVFSGHSSVDTLSDKKECEGLLSAQEGVFELESHTQDHELSSDDHRSNLINEADTSVRDDYHSKAKTRGHFEHHREESEEARYPCAREFLSDDTVDERGTTFSQRLRRQPRGAEEFAISLQRIGKLVNSACEEILLLTVPDVRPNFKHRFLSGAFRPLLFTFLFLFAELRLRPREEHVLLYAFAGVLLLGVGIGWEVYLYANPSVMRLKAMQVAACVATVGGSILWLDVAAGELVAFIAAFGRIFGLRQGFLAQTFLAWGNSIGDVFANIAVARRGEQHMAFAACFASPMFNLLVGQTLSGLYRLVVGGMSRVPLSLPLTLTLTLVFHVLSLLHSLIAIPFVYRCARRFSFERCGTPEAVRESTESNLGFQCRARIGRKVAIGIMVYFACAAACITAVSLGERG